MADKNKKRFIFSLGFYLNVGFSIVFVLVAVLLINQVYTQNRKQSLIDAEAKAKLILDHNLAIHTYFSHSLKPKVFELSDPVRSDDYFEPSWMSSTYAVREIDKKFKSLGGDDYYYKECAINARSPENEADEFEKAFIEELQVNPNLEYRSLIRNLNGSFYYVTLRRGEAMEKTCLRCHTTPDKAPKGLTDVYGSERSFNRSEGEVVSAISIRVPLNEAYQKAGQFSKHLSTIFVLVLLTMFALQYIIQRFIVLGPVRALRNKALQISENEELLGEEISLPVSREFRELAYAFNSMSQKLRYQMDHLEEKIAERTSALQNSNNKLQGAIDEIKTLKGILPVCCVCGVIRDDTGVEHGKGEWMKMDKFVARKTDAKISHGYCPKCFKKEMDDL